MHFNGDVSGGKAKYDKTEGKEKKYRAPLRLVSNSDLTGASSTDVQEVGEVRLETGGNKRLC